MKTYIFIIFILLALICLFFAACSSPVLPSVTKTAAAVTTPPLEGTVATTLALVTQTETTTAVVVSRAEEITGGMSLAEKVGQMFIVGCPQADAAELISQYKLGGYILYRYNLDGKTAAQVVAEIDGYQDNASVPLLISVDEEGGIVNRVSLNSQLRATPFLSSQKLYSQGGWDLIASDTIEKAALLKSLGFNLNLAPVCDVPTDASDYMYKRSFGTDPALTAQYVKTVVETMAFAQIGSVLKHFPGYGNNLNTHTGIAIDQRSYETFTSRDFLPFAAGIAAGAEAVMVSHNIVNCMDAVFPASLSPEVHRILREELGFNGVIMTDDLNMDAILDFAGGHSAAVLAVQAGNDLLCSNAFEDDIQAVIEAVENGTLPEARIDESVIRILNWKLNLGIMN